MSADLSRRAYLRPREIEAVYGIKESYLRALAKRDPAAAPKVRRLPGARGVLLYRRDELEAWIEQHTDQE